MSKQITTEKDLIELINTTYQNAIIEHDRFGNLIIRKNKEKQCEFYFKSFPIDIKQKDKLCSVCEDFIGHTCLSFGFQYFDETYSGGGYMAVADEHDLSNEIINFIDKHLALNKRRYEQLTLF